MSAFVTPPLHRTRSTTETGRASVDASIARSLQARESGYIDSSLLETPTRRLFTNEPEGESDSEDYTSGDEEVDEFAFLSTSSPSTLVLQPHPVEVTEEKPLEPLVAKPQPTPCRVLLMDIEFHQKSPGLVCQWCLQSLDGTTVFRNYWVHWRELHPDWMWLVRERGVELDAWDDPNQGRPLDQVFLKMLVQCCPLDTTTILLFKGTIDIKRLLAHLDALPPSHAKQAIARELIRRDVRYMQIEHVWRRLLDRHLPSFLRPRLLHKTGASARTLEKIYDALFWQSVLVDVPRPGENKSEQVLDTRLGEPVGVRFLAVDSSRPDEVEWLRRGHHQPAFHTAHTDTCIMRDCTLFLLHYASNASRLAEIVRSHRIPQHLQSPTRSIHVDEFGFHLFATYIVRETDWLRTRHLQPTELHLDWVSDCCLQSPNLKRLEWGDAPSSSNVVATQPYDFEDEEEEEKSPVPVVLPSPPPVEKTRWTAPTMVRARAERHKTNGLVVEDRNGQWTKVYVPQPTGRDAFRLRALQHTIRFDLTREGGSVYERLEQERHSADDKAEVIGTRPWYYYPGAVGKQTPGYLILHTNQCSDRKNGQEYGEAKTWSSDSISYIDFDRLPHGLIGTKMRFCKECKVYAEEGARVLSPSEAKPVNMKRSEAKPDKSDVGDLVAWLALLLD